MSIVGTQSVSMSDLMKLGPQALGAMAQGQTQSIAPSYMVLAALKALTDTQKGMQTQVPGQTIKDQVVAQSVPPQQAGIGAMAPPTQKFADGGSVEGSFIDRIPGSLLYKLRDYFDRNSNIGPNKPLYTKEEMLNVPQPTAPTSAMLPIPEIDYKEGKQAATTDLQQPGSSASISASSSTSRGGIGGGKNLLEKYQKTIGKTPGAEEFPLDIPVNKQLEEAVKKYSTPDEKRMKELRDAEARTGILQFGAEMLEGGNFGSTFAKAVNKGNAAQQAEAEKRRAYEDKREAVATELGIKQGEAARADFLAKTEYGDKRAQAAVDAEYKKADLSNQATRFGNQDQLEQAKLQIQREANAIAASVRKDGLDRSKFEKLLALQHGATKVAQEYVDEYVKANPTLMAETNNPDVQRKLRDMRNTEYRRLFPQELEQIMHAGLGMTGAPSAGGKQYRGVMN